MPVEVYPKQMEIIEAAKPTNRNIVLASGPLKSSKTIGWLCALCERAWYLKNQKICVISLTQSVGVDGGIWDVLINTILPMYMGEGRMKWVDKPHNEGVTKVPTFSVSNQFGGVAKFTHRSLKDEGEVEDKFKGPEFTTIFVNELSKFHDVRTFSILYSRLRGMNVPEDELLFGADTNPADEGEDSWIYDLFYRIPRAREEDVKPEFRPFRDKVRLIEFSIDDNLGMSANEKAILYATLSLKGKDFVDRYYWGKWVRSSHDAVFTEVFRPDYHVLGELETPANRFPLIMFPEPNCMELFTGWDPGSTTNWAAVIGEKYYAPIHEHKGLPSVKILENHVVIKQQVDYLDFVGHMQERMAWWEDQVGHEVIWHHYADKSVFSTQDLETGTMYAQLICDASEGEIVLEGVDKPAGSVRASVDLVLLMFQMNRLWVNLRFCPELIDALKSIRRGKTPAEVLDRGSKFKHVIDALRYLVMKVCGNELNYSTAANLRKKRREQNRSSLVYVTV